MPNGKRISEALPPWQHKAYERHRSRVKSARSAIDMNPPQGRPHVLNNAKRIQLESERQARIVRDNFILLKKLCDIMRRKKTEQQCERLKWQESRCLRTR